VVKDPRFKVAGAILCVCPNPDKPDPNKIYFYHENTKVRKHEKENLISHFLFFRGFVIVFNSFANFACLRACLSAVQTAQAGNAQTDTNFTIKGLICRACTQARPCQ